MEHSKSLSSSQVLSSSPKPSPLQLTANAHVIVSTVLKSEGSDIRGPPVSRQLLSSCVRHSYQLGRGRSKEEALKDQINTLEQKLTEANDELALLRAAHATADTPVKFVPVSHLTTLQHEVDASKRIILELEEQKEMADATTQRLSHSRDRVRQGLVELVTHSSTTSSRLKQTIQSQETTAEQCVEQANTLIDTAKEATRVSNLAAREAAACGSELRSVFKESCEAFEGAARAVAEAQQRVGDLASHTAGLWDTVEGALEEVLQGGSDGESGLVSQARDAVRGYERYCQHVGESLAGARLLGAEISSGHLTLPPDAERVLKALGSIPPPDLCRELGKRLESAAQSVVAPENSPSSRIVSGAVADFYVQLRQTRAAEGRMADTIEVLRASIESMASRLGSINTGSPSSVGVLGAMDSHLQATAGELLATISTIAPSLRHLDEPLEMHVDEAQALLDREPAGIVEQVSGDIAGRIEGLRTELASSRRLAASENEQLSTTKHRLAKLKEKQHRTLGVLSRLTEDHRNALTQISTLRQSLRDLSAQTGVRVSGVDSM